MLQGETQDCVVSLALPCSKTCKNLWRSCVDHHSFFNRTARSPKHNNSTVQSYRKLITQHLGLGNSKTERSACICFNIFTNIFNFSTFISVLSPQFAVVRCASVWWEGWCGTQSCRDQFHQSILRLRVCPPDPPQPLPTGTTCSIRTGYNEMSHVLSLS